jgi:hypothetical protein
MVLTVPQQDKRVAQHGRRGIGGPDTGWKVGGCQRHIFTVYLSFDFPASDSINPVLNPFHSSGLQEIGGAVVETRHGCNGVGGEPVCFQNEQNCRYGEIGHNCKALYSRLTGLQIESNNKSAFAG